MKSKILWALFGILFVISAYNAYSNYQMRQDVRSIINKLSVQENNYLLNKSFSPDSSRIFPIERSIPIVAVSSQGEGIVGNLTVKLIPGNNNVLINTNPFAEPDIQYSLNKAVAVAKLRSNYNYDMDFIFDFESSEAQLIGGESAGAAITIATIAALQGRELKNDAVITGTINPDGTIGRIGGVIEKAKAVADAGYGYFLVPRGQSKVTYYEKQLIKEPYFFGFEILNTVYIPKTIDLREVAKKEWGLNIVEVSNIEEALPYFIDYNAKS